MLHSPKRVLLTSFAKGGVIGPLANYFPRNVWESGEDVFQHGGIRIAERVKNFPESVSNVDLWNLLVVTEWPKVIVSLFLPLTCITS